MASAFQSNPVYYSLAELPSTRNSSSSSHTVVLRKQPNHEGFGVYIGEDIPSGLYVVTVERNSPASDANIQPGDRVLAVNGQLISSMSTNPKEALVKAASNSDTLTLTIQSTNILQSLNIPTTNSYKENNDYNKKKQSARQTLPINSDLESYIKSLFANESVQILETSNNNEFVFKSDPYTTSSTTTTNLTSLSYPSHHTIGHKKDRHHRHHHHHHHHHHQHPRQSKRTLQVTKETQTSFDYDEDENENVTQEQLPTSPQRQYPTQPSMGVSHRTLNNQQQPFSARSSDDSTKFNKNSYSPVASPPPNNVTRNSKSNVQRTSQHMAEVVETVLTVQRHRQRQNNHGQISSHSSASSAEQITPPPTSRHPPSNTRDPVPISHDAAPTSRDTVPTSSNPPGNSHDPVPAIERPPEPPPYAETAPVYTSSEPANNPDNANSGAYNVRDAEANQQAAVPVPAAATRPTGIREIQLQRSSDFQGFGFHLQYNKSYYLIQRIETGSPAEHSDLHTHDVIISLNGQDTSNMAHGTFVETVNASTNIYLQVQTLDEYLREHPPPVRNPHTASVITATIHNENDKRKTGISKALGKLTSR